MDAPRRTPHSSLPQSSDDRMPTPLPTPNQFDVDPDEIPNKRRVSEISMNQLIRSADFEGLPDDFYS